MITRSKSHRDMPNTSTQYEGQYPLEEQSEKVALRSELPPLDVVDSGNLVVSSQVTDECRGVFSLPPYSGEGISSPTFSTPPSEIVRIYSLFLFKFYRHTEIDCTKGLRFC